MFRFDYLEKTVLVLVCLVNILWLPIFICHIWEQNYLYEVLDEEDKQNLLAQTLESQEETKYTTEDYTKFLLATRLKNENEKRSKLEKVVLYTFIPFCISNIIFVVPFEISSGKSLMILTGMSHTFLFLTYIILFGAFFYLQIKLWLKFKKT